MRVEGQAHIEMQAAVLAFAILAALLAAIEMQAALFATYLFKHATLPTYTVLLEHINNHKAISMLASNSSIVNNEQYYTRDGWPTILLPALPLSRRLFLCLGLRYCCTCSFLWHGLKLFLWIYLNHITLREVEVRKGKYQVRL